MGGGNAIQNLSYEWDLNDNLTARRDYQQTPSVHETFTYDTLDRLDTSMRNGTPNLDVNYDASGNVTSKSDVGSYTYDATKIHAVTTAGTNTYSYDANGNVISRNGSTLGWTSYDRPSRIDNGTGTVSYLQYDAGRQLWRQDAYSSGAPESTVYVGELLEKVTKDGVTSWKHYVEAPTGTAAVYLRRSDGTASTYYLTHDHLGSTDKVLDAAGGIVTVAESFTALGARRGANWQGTPTPAELAAIASTTRDGFTGHVMLDNVGLVHMQGRVYDPAIGRFLSVDPLVRDVAAPQSWNGYGYVEGRALSWTDPTGFAPFTGPFGLLDEPCDLFSLACNVNLGPDLRAYLNAFIPGAHFSAQAQMAWQQGQPFLAATYGTVTGFLEQHGAEVVDRTLSVVGGAGQVVLGATICSGVATCAGGAVLAAHGASNIYEGVTGTSSLLRDGYHSLLGSAGDVTYSLVNIGTSVYGLTRPVVSPGTWSLFRNISSDYVPAFRTMTGTQLVTEGAGIINDGLGAAGVPSHAPNRP